MEMTSFTQRMFIKISQELKINGWIPETCIVQWYAKMNLTWVPLYIIPAIWIVLKSLGLRIIQASPDFDQDCIFSVLKESHSKIWTKSWQFSRISFWTKHLFIAVNRPSRELFTHIEWSSSPVKGFFTNVLGDHNHWAVKGFYM